MAGNRDERRRCWDYLNWLLKQRKGALSVDPKGRDDVLELPVPSGKAGRLSGKGGNVLRSIEKETSTFCFLTDHRAAADGESRDELMLIFGRDKRDRYKAMDLMEDAMEGKYQPKGGGGCGLKRLLLLRLVLLHPLHALHDHLPRLLHPPELHQLTREERVVLGLLRVELDGAEQQLRRLLRLLEVRSALAVPVRRLAEIGRQVRRLLRVRHALDELLRRLGALELRTGAPRRLGEAEDQARGRFPIRSRRQSLFVRLFGLVEI